MAWLHGWSGLVTGWLLFAIVLSGTLSVFRPEIGAWMRPEILGRTADPVTATDAAIRWLSVHAAHSPAWYLDVASDRAPYTKALWAEGGEYVQRALDPRSGSPASIRDTLGGEFFYRFHFELQLSYPWGRLLAAVAAMVLVLGLLTGIVAHRRFFADFFTFRPGKGQRSWLDAHNMLGVVALPFHLMIAFTGAVTLANLLMPWGAAALYHSDMSAVQQELNPAAIDRPATGHPGTPAPIVPMLREAERRFGPAGLGPVTILNPGDAASVVTMVAGGGGAIGVDHHVLSFDGVTGRILAEHVEGRPAMSLFNFLYGLHVAHFAPRVTRWLYFLSGIMLAGLIGSGLRLWTIKRHHRDPGVGTALVERLNVGVIAGTPAAFAAFFLANRLIPADMAGRSALEVRSVFITWAIVLIVGALRTPARAWGELLGLSALACLGIALAGGVPDDRVTQGVTFVALALAAGFGAAASRSLLRRHGR
ncbi:PepSY domain-containing protein [Gluconacetobacter azotocaptans]|uniref:PepSY domain-containing protein n=1 Tax=Gluconacetobacter azotocaptans TaxID=142834 RepID=A0A7W4JQ16_9PROT|nr:PepSY-associated TM helix domain-containing protein [Gluconacetobacter azotocaptans]MBB2188830.1 PepSY domain-containing protein [Gluconacetobacter azotocaptans]